MAAAHTYARRCHGKDECGLCPMPCQVRCSYSSCPQRCSQACTPCVEQCAWSCEHQSRCMLPCSAPCTRLPCSKHCGKSLECGHQCPGLCGERCHAEYCQMCSGKGHVRVDMLELRTYSEIDLDEAPIVVFSCGHFFTAETLDGQVGMTDVYETNAQGDFIALRESAANYQSVPRCPDCQMPIMQYCTHRYKHVINKAVRDETTRRFILSGNARLGDLTSSINDLETQLRSRRNAQAIQGEPFHLLAQKGKTIGGQIKRFMRKISDGEQPLRKLYDATVRAIRSSQLAERMESLSIASHMLSLSPDQRIVSDCQMQLKLECTLPTSLLRESLSLS